MFHARWAVIVSREDLVAKDVPGLQPLHFVVKYALVGKDLDELTARSVMSDRERNVEAHDLVDREGAHYV